MRVHAFPGRRGHDHLTDASDFGRNGRHQHSGWVAGRTPRNVNSDTLHRVHNLSIALAEVGPASCATRLVEAADPPRGHSQGLHHFVRDAIVRVSNGRERDLSVPNIYAVQLAAKFPHGVVATVVDLFQYQLDNLNRRQVLAECLVGPLLDVRRDPVQVEAAISAENVPGL